MSKNTQWNEVEIVNSVKEMLNNTVEKAGDMDAYQFKDENDKEKIVHVTFKEFKKATESLGTAIAKIGMHDKHVAVIGENSYKWIEVYITMLKSKGVLVPIDKELPLDGIINILNHSESEVLFYAEKYEKWIDEIHKAAPNVKYFIGFSKKEDEGENRLSYNKFKEEGQKALEAGNTTYTEIEDDPNNLRLIVYTSGTTGNPKGVMLTEHNLIYDAINAIKVAELKTRTLSVLPYHHTYESVAGVLLSIHKHVCVCINDNLKNVLKNLQLFKPDYMLLVPAFAEVFYKNIWANAEKTGKAKKLKMGIKISNFLMKFKIDIRKKLFKDIYAAFGGNLKEIISGSAPIRPEIGKFFNDIGIEMYNGYGISECSPIVSVNRKCLNDTSTVGTVLPCCEVKLENVNEEGDGEICVKGDIVMMGYYKEPEKTAKVLKDGWFNTEDYGHFNKKGQLVITGRKKNIIVLANGKNVYPEEIEMYILKIPYVQEAIVKSKKNEEGQEIALIAEVYLNPEKVEELHVDDIKQKLKLDIREVTKELPLYKKIADTEIRKEEFNKTTTNKIKR